MSEFYNLDAIQTSIKKDIAVNSAYLDAWKAITFPTKKDGTAFANMQKNICGAKYAMESYAMQPGEYELTIYTHCNEAGYIHESIKVYELVRYLKDETMIAKTQNYLPKACAWLEQIYKFDLDDIKSAIAKHIEYLENYVEDLKKQLEKSVAVFDSFKSAYANAIKTLNETTAEFSHNDLKYAVKDCVVKRYPYC